METVRRSGAYDTEFRYRFMGPNDGPEGPWRDLIKIWFDAGGTVGTVPSYDTFDILKLPPSHWPHICLTKLVGTPRRFFVEMIGTSIEEHNGFFGNKRPMSDLPLKNRWVMRREFWWSLHHAGPVYSEGPYIGAVDYVRRVRRVITPYRLSGREYAFVFYAAFEPYPEKRAYL